MRPRRVHRGMPERGLLRLTDDAINRVGNGGTMQPYTSVVVLAVVPVLIDTLILLVTYIGVACTTRACGGHLPFERRANVRRRTCSGPPLLSVDSPSG